MTNATNYLQDELIQWMVDGTSFDSPPSSIYVALHTGDPGGDGTNNEVSGGSYSRYQTSVPSDWTIPSTGNFENSTDILFPEATSNWGDVSHFSLWTSSDNTGNALAEGQLDVSITVNSGDSVTFRSNNLSGSFS